MEQLQLGTPFSWGVIAIISLVVAGAMIVYLVRTKEQKTAAFDDVGGVLKLDWTRTGRIDFHVSSANSAGPQQLLLRVEEKKIIENPMGENVVQLRWRLATLDEAKEVVVCWNKRNTEDGQPNQTA